jgi:hypothetical protein
MGVGWICGRNRFCTFEHSRSTSFSRTLRIRSLFVFDAFGCRRTFSLHLMETGFLCGWSSWRTHRMKLSPLKSALSMTFIFPSWRVTLKHGQFFQYFTPNVAAYDKYINISMLFKLQISKQYMNCQKLEDKLFAVFAKRHSGISTSVSEAWIVFQPICEFSHR